MSHPLDDGHDFPEGVSFWGKLALSAVAAIALHLGSFIHGEWHLHSPIIFVSHSLAFFSFTAFLMLVQDYTARSSLLEAILLFGIYLTTLLTSITVYRVYFHRLSRAGFPGPRSARITKLWHAWACKDSRSFLVLDSLARQYGDFVRTGKRVSVFGDFSATANAPQGPSELTITHPDVYQAIDGPGSVCGKADWYDITHPNISLVTARNSKVHDHRRRIWDQGFSTKGQSSPLFPMPDSSNARNSS